MHPFIRILCLLILAVLTPWLPGGALAVAGLLLLAWGVARPATGRAMRRGVKRIRWLLLSLLILYLWFSPGPPALPSLGFVSPSGTGAVLAMQRAGVLLVLVFAAAAFLDGVSPRRLTAALRQLLAWPVETALAMRFADRVGLLLAELPAVEQRVRASLKEGKGDFAERAAHLFHSVEAGSSGDTRPDPLPALEPVPPFQWMLPAGVLLAGLALVFGLPLPGGL